MLTGHFYNHSRPIPDKNKDTNISFVIATALYIVGTPSLYRRIWVLESFAKGGRGLQIFTIKKEGFKK